MQTHLFKGIVRIMKHFAANKIFECNTKVEVG